MKVAIALAALVAVAFSQSCDDIFASMQTCMQAAETTCAATVCPTGSSASSHGWGDHGHGGQGGRSRPTGSPALFNSTAFEAMRTCMEAACPKPTGGPSRKALSGETFCEAKGKCMKTAMEACEKSNPISSTCKAAKETEMKANFVKECTCRQGAEVTCAASAGITLPTGRPAMNCSAEHGPHGGPGGFGGHGGPQEHEGGKGGQGKEEHGSFGGEEQGGKGKSQSRGNSKNESKRKQRRSGFNNQESGSDSHGGRHQEGEGQRGTGSPRPHGQWTGSSRHPHGGRHSTTESP